MKISLVFPYATTSLFFGELKRFQGIRGKFPPLGLAYIASSLEAKGHTVRIIDAEAEELSAKRVCKRIIQFNPQAVGIYATYSSFKIARSIYKEVKNINPSILFIIGGPVTFTFPDKVLALGEFEFAAVGEAEETMPELVSAIEMKGDFSQVNGIIYRDGNANIRTPFRPPVHDLDKMPFPSWHLLPIKYYGDLIAKRKNYTTMFTSRGCPYKCIICDPTTHLGNRFRARSPRNIIEEIELLYKKYKVGEILFFDDIFTFDKNRILELCKLILNNGYDIIWDCRTRADLLDGELMEKMREVGCIRLRLGVESGVPHILEKMKKGITREQILRTFHLANRIGIETVAYFMLGLPGDTKETIRETIDFSLKINPTYSFYTMTVLSNPGTELNQIASKRIKIDDDYWERYLRGDKDVKLHYFTDKDFDEKDLDHLLRYANRKFYSRPKIILRLIILLLRSPYRFNSIVKILYDALIPFKKRFGLTSEW